MKTKERKSGRRIVRRSVLAILVIVGAVGVFYLMYNAPYAEGQAKTRPIPGDATRYDPIASYSQIVEVAGGSHNLHLRTIDMQYVKSDGTLDLTADYGAQVTYDFERVLDNPPASAAPLGAGGNPGGFISQRIFVTLDQPGMKTFTRGTNYYNYGMHISTSAPSAYSGDDLPAPSCPLKQLWDAAIKQDGAPVNAVAKIYYDQTGYAFTIKDTSIRLRFDVNCQLKS